MDRITTSQGNSLRTGDWVTVLEFPKPWWVRLWRWVTRWKPPTYQITEVTETTMTIRGGAPHG